MVFQGHEGDEEYQGEEEFLEDAEGDKELPFFEAVDFLHCEELKKAAKLAMEVMTPMVASGMLTESIKETRKVPPASWAMVCVAESPAM